MFRSLSALTVIALFVFLAGFAESQDFKTKQEKDARAAQIKKDIADLRAKLSKLEAELAKLEDNSPYVGPIKGKGKYSLEVGAKGNFGNDQFQVTKIESANGALVRPVGSSFEFLVQDVLTSGLADGSIVTMHGQWHVSGTYTYLGRTRYVVIPVKGREGWNNKLVVAK